MKKKTIDFKRKFNNLPGTWLEIFNDFFSRRGEFICKGFELFLEIIINIMN